MEQGVLPIGRPRCLHPSQDHIELSVVGVERVTMTLEAVNVVIKKQRQSFVHAHWREVIACTLKT
jgi:hypothetical protein